VDVQSDPMMWAGGHRPIPRIVYCQHDGDVKAFHGVFVAFDTVPA
jgi:hypothetical protein